VSGDRAPRRYGRVRVVHVITGLGVGGAETVLLRLLAGLDGERFDPVVIGLLDSGPVAEQLRAVGIPVFTMGWRRTIPGPRAWWRLRRCYNGLDADLIHGWMYHGNLAAWALSAGDRRRPILAWNVRHAVYGLREEKPLTRLVIRAGAVLSGKPAAIVYNGHESARRHEALGYRSPGRIVIPNGFDTDLFRPSDEARERIRRELGCSSDTLLVGSIGRLHPHKGHDQFLEMAAAVGHGRPEVQFVMVGRGVEASDTLLGNRIAAAGLAGRCHLLGERDDVPAILAALDILVSPSRLEAFPNVVGEAMATGVCVVATDVGDTARLLAGHGTVVPRDDRQAAAAAVTGWLDAGPQARQQEGRAARAHIVANYGLDRMVAGYDRLYRELTDRCGEPELHPPRRSG